MRIFNHPPGLAALRLAPLALIATLSVPAMFGQGYDTSGNAMLKGAYRFRYVATVNYNSIGNVTETTAAEGVINFDGNGNYNISAGSQYIDNTLSSGKFQSYPSGNSLFSGTYAINTAGMGALENIDPDIPQGTVISGTYITCLTGSTQPCGVFIGSSTESGVSLEQYTGLVVNDVFVAVLAGTPPTNASFNSPYWVGALDFAAGGDADVKNALFKINPNGAGSLGTLTVNGQANSNQTSGLSQTISNATYNFASDGNAQFALPAPSGVSTPQVMISGAKTVYESADGNFLLGWTANGYDILLGVKAFSGAAADSNFSGLYYTAGLLDQPPYQSQAECGASSFWGSIHASGNESEIEHQRLWSPFCSYSGSQTDYGSDNYTQVNSDGSATDALGNLIALGPAGQSFIAVSNSIGDFGLTLGIQTPAYSPTAGVYLLPWGVSNAANWDPVTASIGPGELVNLYASGPTGGALQVPGGQACGATLGNVSVTIAGMPAPVCDVVPLSGSPYYQITVLAPFELINSTAFYGQVQVNVGGLLSNQVSVFLQDANSGVFSAGQNGIGEAIAYDVTQSRQVTEANPALPGDTITLALGGMGGVTPAVADGAIGPVSPLSQTLNSPAINANQLLVLFDDYNNSVTGQQATVSFAGLYPYFVGLYQVNVVVPTTVGPGDVYIDVVTDYADVEQVYLPIGGSANAAAARVSVSAAPAIARPLASIAPTTGGLRVHRITRQSADQRRLSPAVSGRARRTSIK